MTPANVRKRKLQEKVEATKRVLKSYEDELARVTDDSSDSSSESSDSVDSDDDEPNAEIYVNKRLIAFEADQQAKAKKAEEAKKAQEAKEPVLMTRLNEQEIDRTPFTTLADRKRKYDLDADIKELTMDIVKSIDLHYASIAKEKLKELYELTAGHTAERFEGYVGSYKNSNQKHIWIKEMSAVMITANNFNLMLNWAEDSSNKWFHHARLVVRNFDKLKTQNDFIAEEKNEVADVTYSAIRWNDSYLMMTSRKIFL